MSQGDRRMTMSEVSARVGLGASTITKRYNAAPPQFVIPHFIGNRKFFWASEVEKWERKNVTASNEHKSVRNLRPNQPRSAP